MENLSLRGFLRPLAEYPGAVALLCAATIGDGSILLNHKRGRARSQMFIRNSPLRGYIAS